MKKGRDIFNLFTAIACVLFAVMAIYWLAAIAFAVVMVVFGVVSALAARVFHWPMKKIAIPAALKLQIGRNRFTAWLGIAAIAACVMVSLGIIGTFHAPAVRRIGQGLSSVKAQLGGVGVKLETVAAEGVGYQRLERWVEWIWAEDVSGDDTEALLAGSETPIPAALFDLSTRVNTWGRELEAKVFEGEHHRWFICVYWFLIAVLAPFLVVSFLVTVYQLSARRLALETSMVAMLLVSLTTIFLSSCFFAAFYLFPFVSHPYHTPSIPFWVATMFYILAASMCWGVVRANHNLLFSPEDAPEPFVAARAAAVKAVQ